VDFAFFQAFTKLQRTAMTILNRVTKVLSYLAGERAMLLAQLADAKAQLEQHGRGLGLGPDQSCLRGRSVEELLDEISPTSPDKECCLESENEEGIDRGSSRSMLLL
jgi:hypothetical protein